MITPAPTFSTPGCDPRHPAPVIDGVTEIRCERKALQVIAAERCVQQQAAGCSCARMACKATVEYARRADRVAPVPQRHFTGGISTIERRDRLRLAQQVASRAGDGFGDSQIAADLGLTVSQVHSLRGWQQKRSRQCAAPGCARLIRNDNTTGFCNSHRDKDAAGRARRNIRMGAPGYAKCAQEYCASWVRVERGMCARHLHQLKRRNERGVAA